MDPAEMRYLEEEDSPMVKTFKGAITGLAAGTLYGTVVATWKDVPRVERNVALPGLIRTLKMMGNHGLTFAAIGGVYIGVEQLVQHFRMKRDFVNGAVGGFVAGASVLGFRARSIPTAISAGAALAVTSALIDSGGQTTRVDNGREYYPYTVEKRAGADS
ncbi:PREDICTED: outer envelope pore protein 16-3, chloroplastic/mitochondrial [Tarenaya hassleriana]|uniref:outer envelope pore protein 16-3, chloroplastic/mitochondrial n=1 Tax=Tarenaya hassleriana TaxID=28532 RepID=UPI00053CA90E|nr:PREDICTED: outer envelope pore protein 16-3, chloroplastic/mitochondrial [Tarenaya hassleriana]XP_010554857.1 PREDICTED: outer envelope pore protein 16-3, chloroplastic/mitochondrial [Tarenaya hassleriana]